MYQPQNSLMRISFLVFLLLIIPQVYICMFGLATFLFTCSLCNIMCSFFKTKSFQKMKKCCETTSHSGLIWFCQTLFLMLQYPKIQFQFISCDLNFTELYCFFNFLLNSFQLVLDQQDSSPQHLKAWLLRTPWHLVILHKIRAKDLVQKHSLFLEEVKLSSKPVHLLLGKILSSYLCL